MAALPHCSPEQNSRFAALRQSAAQSFDPEVHEPMLRELWQRGKLGDDFARVSPCGGSSFYVGGSDIAI